MSRLQVTLAEEPSQSFPYQLTIVLCIHCDMAVFRLPAEASYAVEPFVMSELFESEN